jgi:hypothetical protein
MCGESYGWNYMNEKCEYSIDLAFRLSLIQIIIYILMKIWYLDQELMGMDI